MDDIYTNLENYDDFNKLEELTNENKTLKYKIEEYTLAINKLQKNILQDFDMLAVEHKRLELNYSSLLKTAKAEIERKTHMINELNKEKDKLIINARQTNFKSKFNKFQSDRYNSKCNKSSDTGSIQQLQQNLNPTSQATHTEYKNNNSSPLDSTSTCSGDTRDINDAASSATKNVKHNSSNYISKENSIQLSNNLPNKETETKVKKITNRRKSMPVSSCRDINYSSDDEDESNVTNKVNKIQYPATDNIKQSKEKYYQNHRTYETSSLENNYTQYQVPVSNYSRNKQYYYSDNNNYKSRDNYESSQKRRWNISPDRSNHRSRRDYTDNYYQTYNNRRGYESPPRDKSYHRSRSGDRRYNYRRDRSRDYLRINNETERYAEKHRLQDDLEEPSYKRQKHEHSHRYIEDDGRQRESSASNAALPVLLEMSVSCQSPDYVHPDNHISLAPVKEIRSTAVMLLEDPRLSSKKYKVITDCDKEILTTVIGRNVNITPVNRKLWGFSPIPMPKALIEPPSSYTDNVNKSFNMDISYPSHNMYVDSYEISNRTTNGEHCLRNESTDPSPNTNVKDVLCDSSAPKNKEIQDKNATKTNQTTVDKNSRSQAVIGKNDNKVFAKQLNSEYKIPKKQNSSEFLTSTETLNSNNFNPDLQEKPSFCGQEIPQLTFDSKCSTLSDSIKSNTIDKHKEENYRMEKRQTEDEDNENVIENSKDDLVMARKIVESDLTLSDDTSDNFEPQLTIVEIQKTKCKKNKTKESSDNHKGTSHPKKSESTSESLSGTVEGKEKRPPEEDKIKYKRESTEHTKKQRHRKKSQDGKDCDVDDSKTSKIKKGKKEKEAKTIEIKSKFSELFGDSTSLITCDDLGVVAREPEYRTNFDTLIEDTQDAVDINIKEIEKLQASKLKPYIAQNESVEEQVDRQIAHTSRTIDNSSNENKKSDDLKISIRKNEDKYCIVHEATAPVLNKTMISEVSNVPKTIIISTGIQPQNTFNDVEFRHPLNVTPVEKVVQPFLSPGLEALATSTPAKPTQQDQSQKEPVTTQSDCSSNSTDARIVDLSQTKKQSTDIESQKDSDVPDVRIFVKRRRKAKKITA